VALRICNHQIGRGGAERLAAGIVGKRGTYRRIDETEFCEKGETISEMTNETTEQQNLEQLIAEAKSLADSRGLSLVASLLGLAMHELSRTAGPQAPSNENKSDLSPLRPRRRGDLIRY
jgi:DNA-binding phage protein